MRLTLLGDRPTSPVCAVDEDGHVWRQFSNGTWARGCIAVDEDGHVWRQFDNGTWARGCIAGPDRLVFLRPAMAVGWPQLKLPDYLALITREIAAHHRERPLSTGSLSLIGLRKQTSISTLTTPRGVTALLRGRTKSRAHAHDTSANHHFLGVSEPVTSSDLSSAASRSAEIYDARRTAPLPRRLRSVL